MTADADRQLRLRLLLEAEGRPGLFPLLVEAAGAVLAGRFRLDELLAVGRQSYLFAATDLSLGGSVVVKQPALDYRNPLHYHRASVSRLRQALRTEYRVLEACGTGHLPRPVALLTEPAAVPAAAASPVLAAGEVFLVEEFIPGPTLTEAALTAWPALPAGEREAAARRLAGEFVDFWEALRGAGWHYGDVSAENLLLEEGGGRLRVVDAGSAVPAGAEVAGVGFTPGYTTPQLFAALACGLPVPGTLAAVGPPLAKVVHFALTRREPLNGALPDLDDPALDSYSPACRRALAALLDLDARPGDLPQAREALARWTAPRA
jgi:hypothetical protein